MVVFLSLFLGLVSGVRTVEISAGDAVAAVEIRLDGMSAGRLTRAPWTLDVNFGFPPVPHELLAVGLDANGQEVGRALQKINLPRSLAEATLILLPGSGGKGRTARLSWQCALATEPSKVVVTFDGKPLAVSDPRNIQLPSFVPEQLHFMRAELDFPKNLAATAEITFGGQSRDETQAELTAVPVVSDARKLPPLEGLLLARGRPLRVVAVEEKGPAEIAIVLDEAARATFASIAARYVADGAGNLRWLGTGSSSGALLLGRIAPLSSGQRARFVWPFAETFSQGETRYEIFPHTEDFDRSTGGLLFLLTHVFAPGVPEKPRFADAVSVAALTAVARNRARAVVLVLGGSRDASALSPEGARAYLSSLGVPLFVWTASPGGAAAGAAWAGATDVADVSTAPLLEKAADRLVAHVDRQKIVWVEGTHLPQDVALSPAASGISLAR